MNDARTQRMRLRERLRMIEQGVDERAGIILVCRMRDHPGRLIHHKEILVFVDDIERNVFRKDFRRFRFGKFYMDDLARNYCMAGFYIPFRSRQLRRCGWLPALSYASRFQHATSDIHRAVLFFVRPE